MASERLELSPYRGLAAFGESDLDSQLFFGRDRETEIVAANLQASRLTVLYGASGVGKSSLLRAGVAHHLRRAAAGGANHVVVVCSGWRDDPIATLSAATEAAVRETVGYLPELEDELSFPGRLEVWTRSFDGEIYLVLDQVEEYLLYHGADGGGPLAGALADIVTRPSLRVGVLLGIRDDALAQLDTLKARIPGLFGNLLRLDHLTRDEGRHAIVGPLAELTLRGQPSSEAEPELVETVLDQVTAGRITVTEGRGIVAEHEDGGRIEAPFLQLVMERLWDVERERGSSTLHAATLAELGGAARIVEEHLESALAELSPSEQDTAAAVFSFLVTPSGTKIAHSPADLARYSGIEEATVQPVLEHLAHERLLRPIADTRGGPQNYEIFHDVLADSVLAWSARHTAQLELERTRLDARRRHRRLAGVSAVSVMGLLVAIALMVWALAERTNARDRATEAKASELQALVVNALPTDSGLALALAAEAVRLSPTPAAESALRRALLTDHLLRIIPLGAPATDVNLSGVDPELLIGTSAGQARLYGRGSLQGAPRLVVRHAGGVTAVEPDIDGLWSADATGMVRFTPTSPDSDPKPFAVKHPGPVVGVAVDVDCGQPILCFVTGGDRAVVIWNAQTRRQAKRIATLAPIRELEPLGNAVAVLSADSTIQIVDLRERRIVRRLAAAGSEIETIAADPDQELVAAGLADGSVRVWNARSGRRVASFVAHTRRVLDLDLVGDLLLSGSADGTASVRSLSTGDVVGLPGGHRNTVRSVELSQDGRFALTGSADHTAKVWETKGRLLVALLSGHTEAVIDAAFSADAGRVATGSLDGTARVWTSGTEPELVPRSVPAPALPTKRATTASGAKAQSVGDAIRLRTAAGRNLLLRGHRDVVKSVAFSADGRLLASASRDHDARIWDAATGILVHRLEGHFGAVADAQFSPDGRWVVTAGPSSAGLWDVRSGELVQFLYGPRKPRAASFAQGSRTIVSLDRNGVVRLYRCTICGSAPALLAVADRRMRSTGRGLTPAERLQYLG